MALLAQLVLLFYIPSIRDHVERVRYVTNASEAGQDYGDYEYYYYAPEAAEEHSLARRVIPSQNKDYLSIDRLSEPKDNIVAFREVARKVLLSERQNNNQQAKSLNPTIGQFRTSRSGNI